MNTLHIFQHARNGFIAGGNLLSSQIGDHFLRQQHHGKCQWRRDDYRQSHTPINKEEKAKRDQRGDDGGNHITVDAVENRLHFVHVLQHQGGNVAGIVGFVKAHRELAQMFAQPEPRLGRESIGDQVHLGVSGA